MALFWLSDEAWTAIRLASFASRTRRNPVECEVKACDVLAV